MTPPRRSPLSPSLLLLSLALLLLAAATTGAHAAHKKEPTGPLIGQTPVLDPLMPHDKPAAQSWWRRIVFVKPFANNKKDGDKGQTPAFNLQKTTTIDDKAGTIPERVGQAVESTKGAANEAADAAKARVADAQALLEAAKSKAAESVEHAQTQAQASLEVVKAKAGEAVEGVTSHPAAAHAKLAAEHAEKSREEAAAAAGSAASRAAHRVKDAASRLVHGGHGAPAAPGEL